MRFFRKFAFRHWCETCVALGAAFGITLWYALPPATHTRAILVAIGMLAATITTSLLGAEPRPEWATGNKAKGRP